MAGAGGKFRARANLPKALTNRRFCVTGALPLSESGIRPFRIRTLQ
jgi:hypothetical protein